MTDTKPDTDTPRKPKAPTKQRPKVLRKGQRIYPGGWENRR